MRWNKIAVGSDHAGYPMKEEVKRILRENNYEVIDVGTNSEESTDYPIYGRKVGKYVASGKADAGIVICGTGIGISIAANKVPGVRAAACYSKEMARLSRAHNDTNVLALGGRITEMKDVRGIVETWLNTDSPSEERHLRRVRMIENPEEDE